MISKACYKPHTIFFSLPVRILRIDTVEIKLLSSLSPRKKYIYLDEQFIRLVEIPFYVI